MTLGDTAMSLELATPEPVSHLLQPIITKLYASVPIEAATALLITNDQGATSQAWLSSALGNLPNNVRWQAIDGQAFNGQPFTRQHELALVVASPDSALDDNTRKSLQLCRDLFARHTLVIKPAHSALNLTEFGFSRITNEVLGWLQTPVELWQFNLFDYKQLPDWLNSKFWANPENWDKFRW